MIESAISITDFWCSTISCAGKAPINRICKEATKSTQKKTDILCIDNMYVKYVLKKVKCVISEETHPLHKCFFYMRSGTRLRAIPCKTQRYRKSFVPNSIHLFDKYLSIHCYSVIKIYTICIQTEL